MFLHDLVKPREETVEDSYHCFWLHAFGQWGKADDVCEEDRRLAEAVRDAMNELGVGVPVPLRDLRVYHHDADGRPLADLMVRSVTDQGEAPASKS